MQLLEALNLLEKEDIVHRDLKPKNFLKDFKGIFYYHPHSYYKLGNA